jgi:hypothetical protein
MATVGQVTVIFGVLVMLGTAVAAWAFPPRGADGGWGFVAGFAIGTGITVLGGLFFVVSRMIPRG